MSLTDIDVRLASSAVLKIKDQRILFQFPPKVSSDSKSGEWDEGTPTRSIEPFSVWRGAKPRKFNLEWTYIVGDSGMNGIVFTTEVVKQNIAWLRGYFIERKVSGVGTDLIAYLKLWLIGGSKERPIRFDSIDITHGKSVVVPVVNGEPKVDLAFPLRTDVKAKVAIWTDQRVSGGDTISKENNSKIINGLTPLGIEAGDWKTTSPIQHGILKNTWA